MRKIKYILLFIVLLVVISGCEKITDELLIPPDTSKPDTLCVMTYNVYLGASALELLSVENLLQVHQEVAAMYDKVIASDFPSRAVAIAKSIKEHHPHLIGLQEIAVIRRQSPGDFITGGSVPAEEVVIDYLQLLMDALAAEGLSYDIAAQVETIDTEMPMFTNTGFDDVRLTDLNVILARRDVDISRPVSAHYQNNLAIEQLGIQMTRGYAAVDAIVDGIKYRFVNTHLEAFSVEKRRAQIQELVDILSTETLPIVLVGDFNLFGDTNPLDTDKRDITQSIGYQTLLSAGYVDTWQMDAEHNGYTCCQDADILNDVSNLFIRIDTIFLRNFKEETAIHTQTVGDTPADRLTSGMWASDHAGVVAQIHYFRHRPVGAH